MALKEWKSPGQQCQHQYKRHQVGVEVEVLSAVKVSLDFVPRSPFTVHRVRMAKRHSDLQIFRLCNKLVNLHSRNYGLLI